MNSTVESSFQIAEKLLNIYKKMEISPIGILNNYALSLISNKIQKFELENNLFEKKYNCPFDVFKEKVEKMENEENFEWEDDLMDWHFAIENIDFWQKAATKVKEQW